MTSADAPTHSNVGSKKISISTLHSWPVTSDDELRGVQGILGSAARQQLRSLRGDVVGGDEGGDVADPPGGYKTD